MDECFSFGLVFLLPLHDLFLRFQKFFYMFFRKLVEKDRFGFFYFKFFPDIVFQRLPTAI